MSTHIASHYHHASIFWPTKTLNWPVAASKLHNDRAPCSTAEWSYCPFPYTVTKTSLPNGMLCCMCFHYTITLWFPCLNGLMQTRGRVARVKKSTRNTSRRRITTFGHVFKKFPRKQPSKHGLRANQSTRYIHVIL